MNLYFRVLVLNKNMSGHQIGTTLLKKFNINDILIRLFIGQHGSHLWHNELTRILLISILITTVIEECLIEHLVDHDLSVGMYPISKYSTDLLKVKHLVNGIGYKFGFRLAEIWITSGRAAAYRYISVLPRYS